MQINGYDALTLFSQTRSDTKPKMVVGNNQNLVHKDTVELSSVAARQLPAGVIEHGVAHFFFNAEINTTLEKVLAEKDPEVKQAAYHIIESNIFVSNNDLSDQERSALLEAGLSQAEYLAANYMNNGEASEFLQTMNLLGAVAKTRKYDPVSGNVTYIDLPQRPQGAPSDYVNPQKLMERFDSESFGKLQATGDNPNERASILIQFVKKIRQHPEWVQKYRNEQDSLMKDLRGTKIDNRFEGINTTDITAFTKEMTERIDQTSFTNKDLLAKNVASFTFLLGLRS